MRNDGDDRHLADRGRDDAATELQIRPPRIQTLQFDPAAVIRPRAVEHDDDARATPPKAPYRVVVARGRALIAEHRIRGGVANIGRDIECDVVIPDPRVSALHCRIRHLAGSFVLEDLGSINGVAADGRPVAQEEILPGTEICLGDIVLLFEPTPRQMAGLEYQLAAPASSRDAQTSPRTELLGRHELESVRHEVRSERGAHLVRLGGQGGEVQRIPLSRPTCVLGTARDADIRLRGLWYARRHALLVTLRGDPVVEHVGGWRRVFVNGRAVKRSPLSHRDQLRIGPYLFQYLAAAH